MLNFFRRLSNRYRYGHTSKAVKNMSNMTRMMVVVMIRRDLEEIEEKWKTSGPDNQDKQVIAAHRKTWAKIKKEHEVDFNFRKIEALFKCIDDISSRRLG